MCDLDPQVTLTFKHVLVEYKHIHIKYGVLST